MTISLDCDTHCHVMNERTAICSLHPGRIQPPSPVSLPPAGPQICEMAGWRESRRNDCFQSNTVRESRRRHSRVPRPVLCSTETSHGVSRDEGALPAPGRAGGHYRLVHDAPAGETVFASSATRVLPQPVATRCGRTRNLLRPAVTVTNLNLVKRTV